MLATILPQRIFVTEQRAYLRNLQLGAAHNSDRAVERKWSPAEISALAQQLRARAGIR